ncbi:hypothetical protein GCM10017083_46790 [Thalassobaculum fulvum]|uniref:Uncharacterized protein n=1 Tax=Thalassobaculum fulvum TaxID=1633335 RepID=A0A918XWF7_9PROT|nr:hypothetical protein GCM10017083_46790 [Thalassobaculum fulvum]
MTPIRGTASRVSTSRLVPIRPPAHSQTGIRTIPDGRGSAPPDTRQTVTRAARPMLKATIAAWIGPPA